MNEAEYALAGVALGSILQALAAFLVAKKSVDATREEHVAARKERQSAHRIAVVQSWREGVSRDLPETNSIDLTANASNPLKNFPWYLSLRPHLSSEVRKQLEPPRGQISLGGLYQPLQFILGDEIARIERQWDLI